MRNGADTGRRMVDLGEMATADDLTDDGNWTGGFYELLLDLGAAGDPGLDGAVRSLWHAAGVRECRAGSGATPSTNAAVPSH